MTPNIIALGIELSSNQPPAPSPELLIFEWLRNRQTLNYEITFVHLRCQNKMFKYNYYYYNTTMSIIITIYNYYYTNLNYYIYNQIIFIIPLLYYICIILI